MMGSETRVFLRDLLEPGMGKDAVAWRLGISE